MARRATALVIRVEDRPGMLSEVTLTLAKAGVKLCAVYAGNESGQGVLRLVVDNLDTATEGLAARGWKPAEEEILEVELVDRTGALGEVAKLLGDARVNIRYVFLSTSCAPAAAAYLAVADMDAALRALE
jgi:hypothetical protein